MPTCHADYPWFFILPGVRIGVAVATIHPDLLANETAFTALVTHFVELGGETSSPSGAHLGHDATMFILMMKVPMDWAPLG